MLTLLEIYLWYTGKIKKELDLRPSPSHHVRILLKLMLMAISFLTKFMTKWFMIQKIYSKMCCALCANIQQGVIKVRFHGMVKNIKTWIHQEKKIMFPRIGFFKTSFYSGGNLSWIWWIMNSFIKILSANLPKTNAYIISMFARF